MNAAAIVAGLLGLGVLIAWGRLARGARARPWRIAALASLQPVCAGLLYLTLLPPVTQDAAGTLVVATEGASRLARADVALPEAPAPVGVERVPDLATALRRRPGTRRVAVIGSGLEARDRDAVAGLELAFAAPPVPRGIVALAPPAIAAPGAGVRVAARVAGVPGGSADLIDPAGARVDRRPLGKGGDVTLTGMARAAGAALFRLRVRDRAGAIVEDADVPVVTEARAAPRLLLLAGAAGPEIKYLRRWAVDAGFATAVRVAAGSGVVLGDAPVAVDRGSLGRFDLVVVDARSWAALGAPARAALMQAVRGGLGLVVRLDGAVPEETRRGWRAIGVDLPAGLATVPAPLASGVPILTRQVLRAGRDAVPVWRDGRGAMLADWRAVGRGRVAVWAATDAFTLVLAGHGDLYGRAWSEVAGAVARPLGTPAASVAPLPRAGERVALCGVGATARIAAPDAATLVVDPASGGCAGYWPRQGGWHRLVDRGGERAFYVYPAAALPALRAAERAGATARSRRPAAAQPGAASMRRGASWPWFLALLGALALLWWLERARHGRDAR